jgi:endonuclease/exonuclease/phosphatase family metal-dependent hydrolase
MEIVSWNIQWGRGADGRVALKRTAELLRRLNADVICLQEVAVDMQGLAGAEPEDGVAILRDMLPGYEAAYVAAVDISNGAGRRMCFGNLTLSRFPLGQVWRHLLPWPADPALPAMQRACLEVVVEVPTGPIRVLNTHLEYYSERVRLAQAKRLVALAQEAEALATDPPAGKDSSPAFAPRPRPAAAVLCGDMNCEPGSIAYHALLQGGAWYDTWSLVRDGASHAPTVGLHGAEWPDRPYCCDYFFASGVMRGAVRQIRVMEDTAASDHQPIVLELRF